MQQILNVTFTKQFGSFSHYVLDLRRHFDILWVTVMLF